MPAPLDVLDQLLPGVERAGHERELRAVRRQAFDALDRAPGFPSWPAPPRRPSPEVGPRGLPEVDVADLDAEAIRSAIGSHGSLLVRGVAEPDEAASLVAGIDEAFTGLDAAGDGAAPDPAAFEPYDVPGNMGWAVGRLYVQEGGGLLTADSPRMLDRVLALYERRGVRDAVAGYLGERPVLSATKCTLRRVPPDSGSHWHQDGAFLGAGLRVLNIWLALTDCGEDAPGLDVVPRRFDGIVETGTGDASFSYMPGHDAIAKIAAETPIIRPRFAAGEALLFDELFLHSTAADPAMAHHRYAVESWFFAPSAYPDPDDQVPLVW